MTASRWPISADWCQIRSVGWPRTSRRTWKASWSQLLPGKTTTPNFIVGGTRHPITSRPGCKRDRPLVETADALRFGAGAGDGVGHAGGDERAGVIGRRTQRLSFCGSSRRPAAGAPFEFDADFQFHLAEAQAGVDQDSHKGQKGARHGQLDLARHGLPAPTTTRWPPASAPGPLGFRRQAHAGGRLFLLRFGGGQLLPAGARPAGLVHLAAAGDGESTGRHVFGDGRAGGHVGAPADLDRRHQLRAAADENLVADDGGVLVDPVVIAGDGAGADVRLAADAGIAEVGEVLRLGAFAHDRLLDLDIVADAGPGADVGAVAQVGEGPDAIAGAQLAVEHEAVRLDADVVGQDGVDEDRGSPDVAAAAEASGPAQLHAALEDR